MAAYAALVSLTHLLDQILHPAQRLVFFDKRQIAYLRQQVVFLQDFLESHASQERQVGNLEGRIGDAAHGAEDIIESSLVDQIVTGYPTRENEVSTLFSQDIQRVTEQMDCIKKEVMEIEDRKASKDQKPENLVPAVSSIAPPGGKNTVVGFDGYLIQIMDRLTAKHSNRQTITIVGMGGIGKTTLARNVYEHPCIVHHFDIRAWVAVSQEYNARAILLRLLHQVRAQADQRRRERCSESFEDFVDEMSQTSDDQLGEQLHKGLSGMRYLIAMDDMWSNNAWDEAKMYFPDNCTGSRVMVTSRLWNVAIYTGSCCIYEIDFLDSDKSWDLLCEKVFAGQVPPPELAAIGREIAENCRGLPLAIVVISGLLVQSMTREYWEYVADNISSVVYSESDQHFLKILSLSYRELPIHLKPCFLYMGAFPEDHEVRVSRLVRLWVAEGFLKPIRHKTLEEVAEEHLQDLIDRNLILVSKRGRTGKIKSCKIHDLLRDLCLEEAREEKFLSVTNLCGLESLPSMENERRLCIHQSNWEESYQPQAVHALGSASFARSLVCTGTTGISGKVFSKFRLLRILDTHGRFSIEEVMQIVNSRHLTFTISWHLDSIPCSMFLLWNLQTLIVRLIPGWKKATVMPSEIWQMPSLRHVELRKIALPDPPCTSCNREDTIVLENLQTIFPIVNFQCSEDVLRIIPNVKKLKIFYQDALEGGKEWSHYCLDNLVRLSKLETLNWAVRDDRFLGRFALPSSLKKLTLYGCEIPWEDMTIVGSLPNLEVLKLTFYAFQGPEWEPNEGEFPRLKFLLIEKTCLVHWRAGRAHFPSLESLVIRFTNLEEIPMGIGDSTLQFIQLDYCTDSAISSAKQMQEDRESLGNYDLVVKIRVWKKWEMQSLESDNFHVQVHDEDREL